MKKQISIEGLARYLWLFKLTASGRGLVIAGLAVSVLGVHSLETQAFQLLFSLFFFGFICWLVNLIMRPRVEVTGHFPDRGVAKTKLTGRFTVISRSRLPLLSISPGYFMLPRGLKADPGKSESHGIAPGESRTVSVTLEPLRRGVYTLPGLRVFTTYPFDILRSGPQCTDPETILIYPYFHPLTDIEVQLGSRYQPGGIALTSNVGESPEYIGNREYRPGDSTRHLDFRAWARMTKPVVREFQEEYYCRVALVMDTFVGGKKRRPKSGFLDFEAAVSISAAIADALSRGETIIDIFAAGPELHIFRAGRHIARMENVMEILAGIDESRKNPFDTLTPALASELGRISIVICVFLDWDESRKQLLQQAVESGCRTKVIIVRAGPLTQPVEDFSAYSVVELNPNDIMNGMIDSL